MKRSQLPPHKTATYVLPKWKVVYVSVPKAACTSLKWLMADLQGENPEQFYSALSRETGRSMTIHHRSRWERTPMLHELSEAELEEISPTNGWFIFGVVRQPSARLWSGWQSKFLLKEPRFLDLYPEATWPRVPSSTSDVVEDFHQFVRTLEKEPDQAAFADRHFLTQTRLLSVDRTDYSRIYKTSEIPQLLKDLENHCRPAGLESLPGLLRSNETPLAPIQALFSDEVTEIVGRHYASDFEHFGYPSVLPDHLGPDGDYPASVLSEVGRMVERSERINDLYRIAVELRDKERESQRQLTVAIRRERRAQKRLENMKARLENVRARLETVKARNAELTAKRFTRRRIVRAARRVVPRGVLRRG